MKTVAAFILYAIFVAATYPLSNARFAVAIVAFVLLPFVTLIPERKRA